MQFAQFWRAAHAEEQPLRDVPKTILCAVDDTPKDPCARAVGCRVWLEDRGNGEIAARPPSDQRVAHIANGARHSEADERRGTCQDRFASTLRWRGLASCELPKVNPCTPQPVRPCRRCRSDHHWTRLASIASLASSHTRLWDHSKIAGPGVEHLKAKVNSK